LEKHVKTLLEIRIRSTGSAYKNDPSLSIVVYALKVLQNGSFSSSKKLSIDDFVLIVGMILPSSSFFAFLSSPYIYIY